MDTETEVIEIDKDLYNLFSKAIGEDGSSYLIVVPYTGESTGNAIERDLKGWAYRIVKADH